MGLVPLLFWREKPKGSVLPFGFARQYTSERGRPFINARMLINTHRKCPASAYKRTVVFKWAAI